MTRPLLLIVQSVSFLLYAVSSAPQGRYSLQKRSVLLGNEVNVGVLLPPVELDGRVLDQPHRAILMAVDEINRNPNILPNTRLRVIVNSTYYDRWQSMRSALWQVNVAKVIAIIGGADASEVKVISPIVKEASVPLLSPLAVEFELDSETLYPTFFRVGPAYDRLGRVIQDILEQFSWRRVAVIHSDDDYGLYGVRYAIDRARAAGYKNIRSVYLEQPHNPQLTEAERRAMDHLKADNFRIFVVVLHPGEQAAILRVAAEAGLFGAGYAWVIAHCNYGTDLFVQSTMDGIICIRQQTDDIVTNELWERMQNSSYKGNETSLWLGSVYAYNAVHALAQALNITQRSEEVTARVEPATLQTADFDFRPTPSHIGQSLLNVLGNTTFSDPTGIFNLSNSLRTSNYDFLNYHNGGLFLFATRISEEFFMVAADSNTQLVHFPGGKTIVPLDTPVEDHDTLRVLVPMSFPFTTYVDNVTGEFCVQRPDKSNCVFKGVAIELIKRIASQIGLKLDLHLWTNSWTDMVKEVGNISTDWDLAAGSVTVTATRSQFANFSTSIYDSGLRMLTLKPEVIKRSYFEFFKPFSWSVWLLSIVTLVSAAGVMLYLDREAVDSGFGEEHPNAGKWNRRLHIVSEAMYFAFCVFFGVHRADNINQLFSRIYVVVLSFWVLIMVSAYTANMAAFLTHRQQADTITNYRDLVNVEVGCRPSTSNWNYVKNELSLRRIVAVDNATHAVKLLKDGDIKAYIADTPHVLGIAATDCNVIVVGPQEQQQKYAFPMKPTLRYYNQINKAIWAAVEEDYIIDTFDRVLNNECPPLPQQEDVRTITLEDIGGLFMLACGIGVILVLLRAVFLFWRWTHNRDEENCDHDHKRKRNSVAPV